MDCVKLIEYLISAVSAVLSNRWVGHSPRIYIYIYYIYIYIYILSTSTEKLIFTPMTFLPQSKFGSEKIEWESNPFPYPE